MVNGERLLCRTTWRLGIVKESIDIEVNAQLSHLTIIVGIEDVLAEALVLPDATFGMLCKFAILIVVCIEKTVEVAAGMAVIFVEGTKTMPLVHHVVHLQLWRPAFPDAL